MEMNKEKGFASAAEMSGGVYESLLTTALGLSIAIPVYLFYLFFYGRVKRMVHRIERTGVEMVNIICDAREQAEIVSFRKGAKEISNKKKKKNDQ